MWAISQRSTVRGSWVCSSAAAFRAVYDSLEDHAPLLRPENPAVLFDRAAEQVCRELINKTSEGDQ